MLKWGPALAYRDDFQRTLKNSIPDKFSDKLTPRYLHVLSPSEIEAETTRLLGKSRVSVRTCC